MVEGTIVSRDCIPCATCHSMEVPPKGTVNQDAPQGCASRNTPQVAAALSLPTTGEGCDDKKELGLNLPATETQTSGRFTLAPHSHPFQERDELLPYIYPSIILQHQGHRHLCWLNPCLNSARHGANKLYHTDWNCSGRAYTLAAPPSVIFEPHLGTPRRRPGTPPSLRPREAGRRTHTHHLTATFSLQKPQLHVGQSPLFYPQQPVIIESVGIRTRTTGSPSSTVITTTTTIPTTTPLDTVSKSSSHERRK
ncbi:hypothetical protein VTI28DRAFT_1080 [Corynascus sepedonium]